MDFEFDDPLDELLLEILEQIDVATGSHSSSSPSVTLGDNGVRTDLASSTTSSALQGFEVKRAVDSKQHSHESVNSSRPTRADCVEMEGEFVEHNRIRITLRFLHKARVHRDGCSYSKDVFDSTMHRFQAIRQLMPTSGLVPGCIVSVDTSQANAEIIIKASGYYPFYEWAKTVPCIAFNHIPAQIVKTMSLLGRHMRNQESIALQRNVDSRWQKLKMNAPRLVNTLYEYQKAGIRFGLAARRPGRLLIGDEMGLGKTIQALGLALCYLEEWPLLIVCPAGIRLNWIEELERFVPFLRPDDIRLIASKDHFDQGQIRKQKVSVTSYHMVGHLQKYFIAANFKVVICDESHRIGSGTVQGAAQWSDACVALLQQAKRAILCSGTPLLRNPKNIFSQIAGLNWGYGLSEHDTKACSSNGDVTIDRNTFESRYCNRHHRTLGKRTIVHNNGATKLCELNLLLNNTILLRRLKTDVMAQLPEIRRQVWPIEINADKLAGQRHRNVNYSAISNHALARLEVGLAKIEGIKKVIKRLLQIPSKASKETRVPDEQIMMSQGEMDIYYDLSQTQTPLESQREVDEPPMKLTIFAHHKEVQREIVAFLSENNLQCVLINGDFSQKERHESVRRFTEDPDVVVAIVGITAGGEGLNLVSADTILFAEIPQTYATAEQAIGRSHRIGQKARLISVYYAVALGTIDDWSMHRLDVEVKKVSRAIEAESVDRVEYHETSKVPELRTAYMAEYGPLNTSSSDMYTVKDTGMSDAEDDTFEMSKVTSKYSLDNEFALMVSNSTKRLHLLVNSGGNWVCCGVNFRIQYVEEFFDVLNSGRISKAAKWFTIGDNDFVFDAVKQHESEFVAMIKGFVTLWTGLLPRQRSSKMNRVLQLKPNPTELNNVSNLIEVEKSCRVSLPHPEHSTERYIPWERLQWAKDDENSKCFREVKTSDSLPNEFVLYDQTNDLESMLVDDDTRIVHQLFVPAPDFPAGMKPVCIYYLCKRPYEPLLDSKADMYKRQQDMFFYCSTECYQTASVRLGHHSKMRRYIEDRDEGICSICKEDVKTLCSRVQKMPAKSEQRLNVLLSSKFGRRCNKEWRQKLLDHPRPTQGLFWEVDHTKAVRFGGGGCGLNNLRTLCHPCHKEVTFAQHGDAKAQRDNNSDVSAQTKRKRKEPTKAIRRPFTGASPFSKTNVTMKMLSCSEQPEPTQMQKVSKHKKKKQRRTQACD